MDYKNEKGKTDISTATEQLHRTQKPPYQFTSEELRVLKDCNRESFFHRSLPLCAMFSGGIYYGVKSGFLQGHPKYGATPKIIAAVIFGYFAGKFSYQRKCAEKLMLLPNSPIGEMLRQRRHGHLQETLEPNYGSAMSVTSFTDTYNELKSYSNNVDLELTRPDISGLSDSHRPSLDNPIYEEEMPPVQKHVTTYEELRNQNRDDYQQKRVNNYKESENVFKSLSSTSIQTVPVPSKQPTNKYGDLME